jgi:hypothetical protein
VGGGRIVRAACLFGAGVVALAGCLQLLEIDGTVGVAHDASTEDAAPVCGLPIALPSCESCLNASCCAEMSACGSVPGCAVYETCLLSCGTDAACRAGCEAANPRGHTFAQVPPLNACVVNQCESACGLTCGLVSGTSDVDAAAGCQACIAANNCSAAEACGRSVDCGEVAQCFGACPTLDCKEACANGHDAGTALLEAFLTPLEGSCQTQCGYGADWSCVGSVSVPPGNGIATTVTLTVATIEGAVVAGASVKACVLRDLQCEEPLDTSVTDAQGIATLTVRGQLPIGPGFVGYFDIAPAANADAGSPAIVPFLDFLAYSLSEPTAAFTATALTTTDLANFTALAGVNVGDAGATGDLVLIAFDCELDQAPGVSFAATSGGVSLDSQIRYVSTTTGIAQGATATGSSGLAVLFGAPALQDVVVTETPAQLGKGAGTVTAFTRAGEFSLVSVVPE